MRLEDKIISSLVNDDEFARKVLPFLKKEYFEERNDQIIVEEISKFFNKYNERPSKDILEIEVLGRTDLTQKEAAALPDAIKGISSETTNVEWLIHETEKYFQKRAVYLAIIDSIQIIDGKDKKRSEDSIPSLLQEALSVTFDMQVGHDYIDDSESRFEFYQKKEEGIKFDLDMLNKITDGVGLRKKTLTCIAARTGGGKSVGMCHIAASTLMQGKNVLYITLEMSEERIAQRIDANLFNTPIHQLRNLDRDTFDSRLQRIKNKTHGRLIVKEYPTGGAHAGHFRALIEELKNKKDFSPDLIVVDYLGICSSQRVRNTSANSYTILGSVAEELRSIAQEFDVPVLTGSQLNRGGIDSSDVDMTDTSDSMKIVHALDLYIAFIRTEELDSLGQILVKQLKNRYGDPNTYKRFVVGFDAPKMKLFDVEQSAQQNISGNNSKEEEEHSRSIDDDEPIFSRSVLKRKPRLEFSDLDFD